MLSRAFALLTLVVGVFALAAPAVVAQSDGRPSLILATGSPGGTYYEYGEGVAKLLTQVLNLPVVAQPTEGSLENVQLIQSGKAQIGFVTMGIAQEAWNGSSDWTRGRQYREIRALFPMFETAFQFVALKESQIRSLTDMAGKRIGTGPEIGTAGTYVPRFLSTLNIDATVSHGTLSDLPAQLERQDAAGVSPPLLA